MSKPDKLFTYRNSVNLRTSLEHLEDGDDEHTGEELDVGKLLGVSQKKKKRADEPLPAPKRAKTNTTTAPAPTRLTKQLIAIESSSDSDSSLSELYDDVQLSSVPVADTALAKTFMMLRAAKENVYGLERIQTRAASATVSMDIDKEANQASTTIKLQTDKLSLIRDRLGGIMSCPPELISMQFYARIIDVTQTPQDYDNDVIQAKVLEKAPSKSPPKQVAVDITEETSIHASQTTSQADTEADLEKEFAREVEMKLQSRSTSSLEKAAIDTTGKIKLRLKFPDGTEQWVRISSDDSFSKLLDSLAQKSEGKKVVLSFDGEKLDRNDTPADLDMEEDDMIDARFV